MWKKFHVELQLTFRGFEVLSIFLLSPLPPPFFVYCTALHYGIRCEANGLKCSKLTFNINNQYFCVHVFVWVLHMCTCTSFLRANVSSAFDINDLSHTYARDNWFSCLHFGLTRFWVSLLSLFKCYGRIWSAPVLNISFICSKCRTKCKSEFPV